MANKAKMFIIIEYLEWIHRDLLYFSQYLCMFVYFITKRFLKLGWKRGVRDSVYKKIFLEFLLHRGAKIIRSR